MQSTPSIKPRNGIAPVIRLHITARDAAGNVIARQTKENDIYLWNWAVLIAQLLKLNFAPSDTTVYAYKNTAGTNKNTVYNAVYGVSSVPWNGTWRVQIGSGGNAPVITDYSLQTFVKEVVPTLPDIVIPASGNVLKLVFSSTFPFTAETICAETAIQACGSLEASIASTSNFLLTRATF
ncbi:hypothetical protein, partial [Methanoregula sp.]|uniref:hypothetical protein n=1 Tax=Methanoregula sp. TaxID=2052170 RepID=UPI000CB3E739